MLISEIWRRLKEAFTITVVTSIACSLPDMGRCTSSPCLWDTNEFGMHSVLNKQTPLREAVDTDAEMFKSQYEREVQCVFSRVQHHWHSTDKDGNDVPKIKLRRTRIYLLVIVRTTIYTAINDLNQLVICC